MMEVNLFSESMCSKFNDKIMQTGGIDLEQTASEIINPHHPVINRRPPPTPRNKSIKTWQSYRQFRLPTARRRDEWKPLSSRMRGNFENDLFWSSFSLLFAQSLTLVRLKKCQSKGNEEEEKSEKSWQSSWWNKAPAYEAYCARNAVPP